MTFRPMPPTREECPGEVMVDHVLPEAERLEDLRAAVALDGGDAHLRGDLDHALGGRLDEVLAGRLVIDGHEDALPDHVVDRLEGDIGIDGAAAVADQQREVVHLAGLARLQDQAHARAQALADQVVVQAGNREERRHRRVLAVDAAVAQDEDVDLLHLDQAAGRGRELLHGLGQALLAAGDAEKRGARPRP